MSEQEEFEFRARMEAESAAPASPGVKSVAELPKKSGFLGGIAQAGGDALGGAVRGAGSIGATLLWPYDAAKDAIKGDRKRGVESLITGQAPESRNAQRRRSMDEGLREMGVDTDSALYGGLKLGAEIAGTAGVGGALVGGTRAVPLIARYAPRLAVGGLDSTRLATAAPQLLQAIKTSGMSTGAAPAATWKAAAGTLGARTLGGATTGALSAGLADPGNAGMGAGIGMALPGGMQLAGKLAGYAGRSAKSLVQPFTAQGQDAIAGNIIRRFSEGGPTAVNAAELVPGSIPTLAEATGNSGIATLQRVARDVAPNAFAAREAGNAAARNAAFDDLAGDAGKLDFFRQTRSQTGKELYENALKADTSANFTPYVKGQITQLLKRPSINDARKTAQQWAIERGEKPSFGGNMRGLHDMKMAIDDEINVATRAGKGGQVRALEATQAKLLDVMEKLSPAYKEARLTYAAMSKPVNAMESLQGLKLTDAQGNITLSKVKNAIESLERSRNGVGLSPAKSIEDSQLSALRAIQADLLRQTNTGLGRSAGSSTFQNLATDNIVGTLLPGQLGNWVTGKFGGALGQVGRLAYSGPNEAIRGRLADMMLDPNLARSALNPSPPQLSESARRLKGLLDRSGTGAYRVAPLLSSDQ